MIVNLPGTFTRWDLVAKTGPIGDDLVIDIMLSSDGGSTWLSLWDNNPSDRPTLIDGGDNQALGVSFDTFTFASGDLLRMDVVSIGSSTAGANVSLAILGVLD